MVDQHTLWNEPFKDRELKLPICTLEKREKCRHITSFITESDGEENGSLSLQLFSGNICLCFKLQNVSLRADFKKINILFILQCDDVGPAVPLNT